MNGDESWGDIWKRIRRQSKIKSRNLRNDKDFPNSHRTADEILEQDLSDTLETAAEEVKEPPTPTKRYRLGARLGEYSERSKRGWRKARLFIGGLGGLGLASLAVYDPSSATGFSTSHSLGAASQIGGTIGGAAALGLGDLAVSKGLEKTGEKVKGSSSDLQATANEKYGSPRLIPNRLSERENEKYALKAFRDGIEWTETADREEIEEFLDDLSREANTDWRVKRKANHPLQVVGITAEYPQEERNYEDRIELAEEIAEEENISVEEILNVGEDKINQNPVPTSNRYNSENTYEFVIVDTNPDYSFDIENDFHDYSSIIGVEDKEEYDTAREDAELIIE